MTNLISFVTVPLLFRAWYAVSTPAHVAAPLPNAVWMYGTFHEVYGNIVVETSKHPVEHVTTTSSSVPRRTCLAMMDSGHPAQSLCPLASLSGDLLRSLRLEETVR
ncbi:MAG: hypothetical protein LBM39_02305 [Candidatus Methanoplasma sp.]|nr:hypothetical protein [Candidatus Methanoplasma sp.]